MTDAINIARLRELHANAEKLLRSLLTPTERELLAAIPALLAAADERDTWAERYQRAMESCSELEQANRELRAEVERLRAERPGYDGGGVGGPCVRCGKKLGYHEHMTAKCPRALGGADGE